MTISRFGRARALAALLAAGFLLPACAGGDEPAAGGQVGSAMPRAELPVVGGPSTAPPEVANRVVLYEFWATWCTPCHVQVEILKALYPDAQKRGIEFVGVATGEPVDLVKKHLAEHPSPYPVLLDEDERLGTALEVLGLPTLVVVDRAGTIVWRNTSLTDRTTLERAFAAAGAPAPAPTEPAATP